MDMFWVCKEINAAVELTEAGFMRFNKASGEFETPLTPSEISIFGNSERRHCSEDAALAFERSKSSAVASAS
ncbi:MAG: hypothetical protein Q4E43_08610 [Akkermansia sp.]|nr:hypothetical protein [Akkermansia sp.]